MYTYPTNDVMFVMYVMIYIYLAPEQRGGGYIRTYLLDLEMYYASTFVMSYVEYLYPTYSSLRACGMYSTSLYLTS